MGGPAEASTLWRTVLAPTELLGHRRLNSPSSVAHHRPYTIIRHWPDILTSSADLVFWKSILRDLNLDTWTMRAATAVMIARIARQLPPSRQWNMRLKNEERARVVLLMGTRNPREEPYSVDCTEIKDARGTRSGCVF
jgi:hypothetical protein